jgi:menaquinone-dependent protoporphyrinogen oxidase
MKVLVAYASRHGATAGIAERIAEKITEAGHTATAVPAKEARDVESYDAFVVGSAAYMFHWLKHATRFVNRQRSTLEQHPVWLFSSGPVGTDLVDEKGRDVMETSRPKEFDQFSETIHPKGERIFFGAWDPDAPAVGAAEKFMKLMPAAKSSLPTGDFRDWEAIDAWATEIASQLDH